jgi:hypothetical protein
MDKYDKALVEQALADKKPQMGDELWHLLIDRQNSQNNMFEFTPTNIEKINAINNWLRDIEMKAVDHTRQLVTFLKAQQNEGRDFRTDFELEYELKLWSPTKLAHLEELEGNPFYTFRTILPNFKKYTNSETNPYEWEIDDESESLNWVINDNHNEFECNNGHPLSQQHHCWLFHELYHHTYLSLQDIVDIEEIWMEVVTRHQHISVSPIIKNRVAP